MDKTPIWTRHVAHPSQDQCGIRTSTRNVDQRVRIVVREELRCDTLHCRRVAFSPEHPSLDRLWCVPCIRGEFARDKQTRPASTRIDGTGQTWQAMGGACDTTRHCCLGPVC